MEITLETLYQEQQRLARDFEQKLSETRTSIIQWVVGLFIGAIIVIGASVALATTAVLLVTR